MPVVPVYVIVAVVCFRRAPYPAVYDRGHLFAAGRELVDDARHVDVVQVCRIPPHLYPEYGQVGQVAVLRGNVIGPELPVVHAAQVTLIGACRVAGGLPILIREGAIAHEGHRRRRMILGGVIFRCRA